MRLIDADKFKSYIDCGHLRSPTEVCFSELDVCNMIDKQPAIEAVQGVGRYEKAMQKLQEMPKYLNGIKVKQIKKISSEAVQGEWTYLSGLKGSYMTISCPICGSTFDGVAEWKYHFCPNCGARMKGGAE